MGNFITEQILKDYKKQEDKLCLSQVLDKIEFSKTRQKIEYTDFLDMYQVSLVENFLRKITLVPFPLHNKRGFDGRVKHSWGRSVLNMA